PGFQTSDRLIDRSILFAKLTHLSKLIKSRSINRHQSLIACVTRPPRSLPLARKNICRPRHNSNRQFVVKQVTIPVLANPSDESGIEIKHLKHQHCVADVDSKLAFVSKMTGTLCVVAKNSARRRHFQT